MGNQRYRSIRRKLTLIVLITCGNSILLTCFAIAAYDVAAFRKEMASQLATLAEVTSSNLTAALAFGDSKSAGETLISLKAQPHVVEACVYAPKVGVFAKYARDGSDANCADSAPNFKKALFQSGYVSASAPIELSGEYLGTIVIKSDLEPCMRAQAASSESCPRRFCFPL